MHFALIPKVFRATIVQNGFEYNPMTLRKIFRLQSSFRKFFENFRVFKVFEN
jgi:hypothetical protein